MHLECFINYAYILLIMFTKFGLQILRKSILRFLLSLQFTNYNFNYIVILIVIILNDCFLYCLFGSVKVMQPKLVATKI